MSSANTEKERWAVVAPAHGVVLEIGFGSGLNLPFYRDVTKLYALDPSRELYHLAEERIRTVSFPVEYIPALAEHIPLPDQSVDTVVSTWTMCTIPQPSLALQEIKRVLRPGGAFLFIEHGVSPNKIVALFQRLITPFSKCCAGGCHLDRPIEKLIREAGFVVEDMEMYPDFPRVLKYTYKGKAFLKI